MFRSFALWHMRPYLHRVCGHLYEVWPNDLFLCPACRLYVRFRHWLLSH